MPERIDSSPRPQVAGPSLEDTRPAQRPRTGAGPSDTDFAGLPRRPPNFSLDLSAPRARLWEQTSKLAGAPLVDNAAHVAMTGVLEDAGIRPAPGRPAPHRPAAPAEPGFMLPSVLPIPPDPAVTLPSGEPPEVASARRLVVDWLAEARTMWTDLHREKASPDDELDASRKLDKLTAPAVVAALNDRHPDLRLVYAHQHAPGGLRQRLPDPGQFGSVAWDDFIRNPPPGRSQVLLDNEFHNLALDLMVTPRPGGAAPAISVVAFTASAPPEFTRAQEMSDIATILNLPANAALLAAAVPAQKSSRSCRVFALSMALKSHRDTSIDQLHRDRLEGRPVHVKLEQIHANAPSDTDSASDSDTASGSPQGADAVAPRPAMPVVGQAAVVAAEIAGPQFMKHAQSRSDVLAYIKDRAEAAHQPVNKQGQTLLQRHDLHRVLRNPGRDARKGPQIYSASIELKRIEFLDQAIRHAARCDPGTALKLAHAMQAVDKRWIDAYNAPSV